jgi:hypothetical protein
MPVNAFLAPLDDPAAITFNTLNLTVSDGLQQLPMAIIVESVIHFPLRYK